MKKIILMCLFGLMFGQANLSTKVYPVTLNFNASDIFDVDLTALTGYDLDYAIIKVVKASNFYVDQPSVAFMNLLNITIKTPSDNPSNNYTLHVYDDIVEEVPDDIVYIKDTASILNADYDIRFEIQFTGTLVDDTMDLLIAVTAGFPEEDILQGDMNDDNFLDVSDIVLIVNSILAE